MSHEVELIVNADDYGLTPDVSRGIRLAHDQGIVTSTTVLMNSEVIAQSLKLAASETPNMGIGVHLNLTHGSPILPAGEVSTLVGNNREFPKKCVIFEALPRINPDHVYNEWKAQIEKMLEIGIIPDHLDSHHHISYLSPILFTIMVRLAHEMNLPIRHIPEGKSLDRDDCHVNELQVIQSSQNILAPKKLITGFFQIGVTRQHLIMILADLIPGTTEIMTHPCCLGGRSLAGISGYVDGRMREFDILCSPEIKRVIEILNIKLTNFKSLKV